MSKSPLLFKSDADLELYKKQSKIEIERLELRRFDNEIKKERMPTYALIAISGFGVLAFIMQFCPTPPPANVPPTTVHTGFNWLPVISDTIQAWGRNFLMVIIGGLTALLPTRGATSKTGEGTRSSSGDTTPTAGSSAP